MCFHLNSVVYEGTTLRDATRDGRKLGRDQDFFCMLLISLYVLGVKHCSIYNLI